MGVRQVVARTLKATGMHGVAKSIERVVTGQAAAERAAARTYTDFYKQFVKPGDLVFDVGANVGNRTGPLLALGARVVAVEPQSACIETLKRLYGANPRFTLEACALGPEVGELEMMIADAHTVSTLSPQMIERTKASGRFADVTWSTRVTVPIRRFDELIERHGTPVFTKIDVEGFEAQVLAGLSKPIPLLSLEFMRELMDVIEACNAHLSTIGDYRWNYGLGEGMTLQTGPWRRFPQLLEELAARPEKDLWGDVYARLN